LNLKLRLIIIVPIGPGNNCATAIIGTLTVAVVLLFVIVLEMKQQLDSTREDVNVLKGRTNTLLNTTDTLTLTIEALEANYVNLNNGLGLVFNGTKELSKYRASAFLNCSYQCCSSSVTPSPNPPGLARTPFNSVIVDPMNSFNTVTNQYQVPISGTYLVVVKIDWAPQQQYNAFWLFLCSNIQGTLQMTDKETPSNAPWSHSQTIVGIYSLQAGEQIHTEHVTNVEAVNLWCGASVSVFHVALLSVN